MRKPWRVTLAVAGGLLLIVIAVAGLLLADSWRKLQQPYRGYAESEKIIEVRRGSDAASILAELEAEGIVRDARLARFYLVYRLDDPYLRAGEYRFDRPLSTPQVLDKLIRGDVVTYPLTLIEGLTLAETVDRLAASGFGERREFEVLVTSPARIQDLDPDASDLEGYLFPDTYQFARGTTPDEIVATLVATFRRNYERDILPLLEAEASPSPRQVVTLASIVETEARLDDERPIIAGVYANRLRIGMPLQADPTVIYALSLAGDFDGNLRRDDLKFDSPYNTYVYPGLPPGPIASPGLASLLAAARPADVPYLYFVSRNDGSHVFAETLREHNRNVNEWQKVYWRRKWAEERRRAADEGSADD